MGEMIGLPLQATGAVVAAIWSAANNEKMGEQQKDE
jgi:hypothetical protein